jgi:hypothetical protein
MYVGTVRVVRETHILGLGLYICNISALCSLPLSTLHSTLYSLRPTDLALLAKGDVHIGSWFSNFRRIAHQLSHSPAYASTDAKWCPFTTCTSGWFGPHGFGRFYAVSRFQV